MTKPRIFVYIHYLEIGGAERALIGLLNALDPDKADIDLFVNQHTGEFMSLIPSHVRLLPEIAQYAAIERPMADIIKEGHIGIAIRRLIAKRKYSKHRKSRTIAPGKIDESIFQYVFRQVSPSLPDLGHLGTYDLAISFLHPHNIVLDKVKARKKICWIHTDYSTVYVDKSIELPIWSGYDTIAGISAEAVRAFADAFPSLNAKLVVIENILSPASIRSQAAIADVSGDMAREEGETLLLSVGRFSPAKRFDQIPRICRKLKDAGIKFKWYIVGYGPDAETKEQIERLDVADTLILLGKKENPYPYMNACDIYVQPSLYEGKSVTVREAQILAKPVMISAYPTAHSQVNDGIDGIIGSLDIDTFADDLRQFIADTAKRQQIATYLRRHDYGNETETNKIYAML